MSESFVWVLVNMLAVALIVFLIIAYLLRGFFWQYLKVKRSRGTKLLVKVRSSLVDYFAIGYMGEGDLLVVKTPVKTHRLNLPDTAFYRMLGVVCVDIDEKTSAVITRDYKINSTFDNALFDNVLTEAMSRPVQKKVKDIILLVLIVLTFLVLLFVAFKVNDFSSALENMRLVASNSAIQGVNL